MSDIRFSKSRSYERFYITFHIAAALICIALLVLTFCIEGGFKFIPVIFIIAALICFLNAYDKVNTIKKTSLQKRKCIYLCCVGALALVVAVITLIGFWS